MSRYQNKNIETKSKHKEIKKSQIPHYSKRKGLFHTQTTPVAILLISVKLSSKMKQQDTDILEQYNRKVIIFSESFFLEACCIQRIQTTN